AAREHRVLEQTMQRAAALGLEPQSARELLALQIRLAVRVQMSLEKNWQSGAQPQQAADLKTELRPRLDQIGERLVHSPALAAPRLRDPGTAERLVAFAQAIDVPQITAADREDLARAVAAVRSADMTPYERMKSTGVLRIGMTGDYAPFSVEDGG